MIYYDWEVLTQSLDCRKVHWYSCLSALCASVLCARVCIHNSHKINMYITQRRMRKESLDLMLRKKNILKSKFDYTDEIISWSTASSIGQLHSKMLAFHSEMLEVHFFHCNDRFLGQNQNVFLKWYLRNHNSSAHQKTTRMHTWWSAEVNEIHDKRFHKNIN